MNSGRPARSTRGFGRRNGKNNRRLATRVNHNSKLVNGGGVVRVAPNKQLISIPNHNYQLKIQRNFRIFSGPAVGGAVQINTVVFRNAIANELGLDVANVGVLYTIHDVRVYCVSATAAPASMLVAAFDLEEPGGTTDGNQLCLFEDNASSSGIAHVQFFYPLATRPTFSISEASLPIVNMSTTTGNIVTIDMIVTVTRTPKSVTAYEYLNPPDSEEIWDNENDLNSKFEDLSTLD